MKRGNVDRRGDLGVLLVVLDARRTFYGFDRTEFDSGERSTIGGVATARRFILPQSLSAQQPCNREPRIGPF
jgi:hypothetical protein